MQNINGMEKRHEVEERKGGKELQTITVMTAAIASNHEEADC